VGVGIVLPLVGKDTSGGGHRPFRQGAVKFHDLLTLSGNLPDNRSLAG